MFVYSRALIAELV